MASNKQRLKRALKEELPTISFDEDVIEYLAEAIEGGGEVSEDAVADAWSPFFISHSAASDDESARDVSRRVLSRLGASADAAASPGGTSGEKALKEATDGLIAWLDSLRLTQYSAKAQEWFEKAGAADVEEVKEKWEDFAEAMELKPLERKRVQKDCTSRPAPSKGVAQVTAGTAPSASSSAPPPVQAAIAAAQAEGRHIFGPSEDPYIILNDIGSGATATVHRCVKASSASEDYAVKIISLARFRLQRDSSRALEKLHRETAILFSLRHSNIVSLYDVVETPDRLYLVMELVEGGELFHDIVKNGRLTETEARYVFLQIADALKYIHSKGIVHRDLKPENVLVDRKASKEGLLEVKISDFGHSKLVDDGYSTALTQVGTPQYWAPEVSDARPYTETVDLWSLGVVLFVMLEGEYPLAGDAQIRKASFHFREDSKTSAEARDLIRALIKVKPEERLPLEKCLRHPWVMSMEGPVSKVMKACCESKGDVECFELGSDPDNVTELKRALQKFMTKFKFSAVLRKRQVEVTWNNASSLHQDKDTARAELLNVLAEHVPNGGFRRPPPAGRSGGYRTATQPPTEGKPLSSVKEERTRRDSNSTGVLSCVTLRVVDGKAGLDLEPEQEGMKVRRIDDKPGQDGLLEGDLIVKINDETLARKDTKDVGRVFGKHFRDGVSLTIRRKAS